MYTVSMSGSLRENVGKKDAKTLRRQGLVPCVVYGGKEEQVKFTVEQRAFKSLLFTPDTNYVELEINGAKTRTILQDIQYHPLTGEVLHADFLRIFDDKPVTIAIPVKTTGTAPGVLQGGKLMLKIRKLKVKGLPDAIPQYAEVSIDGLEIGQGVKVEQIHIDNVELMDVKSSVVVWVKPTRASGR